MLVKDLILAHTPKEVYPIYNTTYGILGIPDIGYKNRRTCFFNMYKALKEVEPVVSGDIVLGCVNTCQGLEYVETTFLEKGTVKQELTIKSLLDAITPENVNELSTEFICSLFAEITLCFPSEYDPVFLPWPDMLGFEIPEDNLRTVGELQMLARLMFDISLLGFDEDEAKATREEIIMEMELEANDADDGNDEDENDYSDATNIIPFNRFSDDDDDDDDDAYGEYDDDDNDNDIEANRTLIIEELFNNLAKYKAIKEFCDGRC